MNDLSNPNQVHYLFTMLSPESITSIKSRVPHINKEHNTLLKK
ncbi:hypothetical protein ZORO111903_00330 [Zobellia roscoffensis]